MKNEIQEVPLFGTTPLSPVEFEALRLKRFGLDDSDIFVEICLLHGGIALVKGILEIAQAKAEKFTYGEDIKDAVTSLKAVAESLTSPDETELSQEDWDRLQYQIAKSDLRDAQL